MKIKKVIVGPLETNCYILEEDNYVIIIDPGDEAEKIKKEVGSNNVVGILITHHHFDHVGALEELQKFYQTKVYDRNSLQEQLYQISPFSFQVIYTPGHKEDSISFLFLNHLFCGDFIFKDSIGRTDLEGGSMVEMQQSIEKIKQYPEDVIIYPGHGPSTTLKDEKEHNLYFT